MSGTAIAARPRHDHKAVERVCGLGGQIEYVAFGRALRRPGQFGFSIDKVARNISPRGGEHQSEASGGLSSAQGVSRCNKGQAEESAIRRLM
jgi:hypothetical protein